MFESAAICVINLWKLIWTMDLKQVYTNKEVDPKVVLKRLSASSLNIHERVHISDHQRFDNFKAMNDHRVLEWVWIKILSCRIVYNQNLFAIFFQKKNPFSNVFPLLWGIKVLKRLKLNTALKNSNLKVINILHQIWWKIYPTQCGFGLVMVSARKYRPFWV